MTGIMVAHVSLPAFTSGLRKRPLLFARPAPGHGAPGEGQGGRAVENGRNVARRREAQGQAAVEVEARPLSRKVQEPGGAGGEARD
jgi:hypothetical protein